MPDYFRPSDEIVVYVANEAAKRIGYSDIETKERRIKTMIQTFNKTGAVELMIGGLVASEERK